MARDGETMKSLGWVMRMWIGPALLAALLLALGVSAPARGQSSAEGAPVLLPALSAESEVVERTTSAFVPGEIAVGIRRDAIGAAAVTGAIEASVIEEMSLAGLDGADGDAGVDGFLLRVPVGAEWETIERLLEDPAVAFAEPNWYVYAADAGDELRTAETPFAVNDPLYADEQWYMQRIFASRAWALSGRVALASTEDLPIEVVVIDSGVDATHRDLRDNLSLTGINYFTPTLPPVDDCGHGTHVAGLIAAGVNNDLGIAGGAADVSIAAYKTLHWAEIPSRPGQFACIGPVAYVVEAIRYATDIQQVDIINLSLELDEEWEPLEAAVNYARSQGVLVIGASGNCLSQNCPVRYPAKYGAVLALAATDYFNGRAPYSPKGDELDLAAPGGTPAFPVLSTWPASVANRCPPGAFRLEQGDGYCEEFGTSMAAAVATGAAALAWSVQPSLDAEAVRDLLEETTQPLPLPDDEAGDGLIDAHGAVRYALRSRLNVEPQSLSYVMMDGAAPFETALLLENPSLEPVSWLITETQDIAWLDVAAPYSGTVRYGEPVRAELVISSTHLLAGTHRATFSVESVRADGSRTVVPVGAELEVVAAGVVTSYLPAMGEAWYGTPMPPFVPYSWERPDALGRRDVPLLKDSSTGVTLPVTITMGSQVYSDVRIYSDGYVVAPAAERVDRSGNVCLPVAAVDGVVVFGWWGDLDPTRGSGEVSVFRAGPDRSVIEFADAYVAGGERVTFQIVLYEDGRVGVNYRETPSMTTGAAPLPATVGMQRTDGRFYNQIACVSEDSRFGQIEVGVLPQPYQSLLYTEEDLF